jgi:glutathione S-transferase
MIQLIQFPWSPFCIVQRRILEYSGTRFKITAIPNGDRSLIWKITKQRYYQVPVIRDGKSVIFETDDDSQVIAKYLDAKLNLDLFPRQGAGLQRIVWNYIEHEVEGLTFKLNDIYYEETVPVSDRLGFLRHKERKFGRGCINQWRDHQGQMLAELSQRLLPFEQMLADKAWLLDSKPRFIDFDLFGMLANFLYSGHYELPKAHTQLQVWYERIGKIRCQNSPREKLHS